MTSERRRIRFSLRSLLLLVCTTSALINLWYVPPPWQMTRLTEFQQSSVFIHGFKDPDRLLIQCYPNVVGESKARIELWDTRAIRRIGT